MNPITPPKLRAVAYMRKSTRDQQENSIYNQRLAIDAFAQRHEIQIVKYLTDDGISGLTMEKRDAFKELINDYVIGGKVDFRIILVLDVTRWGRFQDIDQSAHLEYICRQHGKEIIFVTESFKNDNSIMDTVIKSIKRAMAAEYSKNLGDKVLAGSLTIAKQGYRLGGMPPYGFERMRLDQQRNPVGILHDGERKAIANERIKLVPGDNAEVETVRDIFQLFAERKLKEGEIAVQLNHRNVPSPGGKIWTEDSIRVILRNEIYTGANLYNRVSGRLHGPSHKNPRSSWIVVPGAFEALVQQELFEKAQLLINERNPKLTDQELLERLKVLFELHGKLTGLIIEAAQGLPSSSTIAKRFGTLINAYRLIGYDPGHDYRFLELRELVDELESSLASKLIENLERMGLKVLDHGTHFSINEQINISVIGSSVRNRDGRKQWVYRFDRERKIDITVAVRLADDDGSIQDYYFFPMIAMEMEKLMVSWTNGVYLDAFRFDDLLYFYDLFGDAGVVEDTGRGVGMDGNDVSDDPEADGETTPANIEVVDSQGNDNLILEFEGGEQPDASLEEADVEALPGVVSPATVMFPPAPPFLPESTLEPSTSEPITTPNFFNSETIPAESPNA